jgi:hypothetical protein
MATRRNRLILLAAVLAILVVGIVTLSNLADYRAAQFYIHRLKRQAQGPWPKETVAQAVIVTLDRTFLASSPPRDDFSAIGAQLREVLEKAKVGHFDGSECAHARCALFMYGPDARKLFDVVRPVLRQTPVTVGASVELRIGSADAQPISVEKVTL